MKLNKNAKQLLEQQVQAMLNSSGKSGSSGRWPMPVLKTTNEASIHSEPFVAQAFYRNIQLLKKNKYSLKRIAQLFSFPSGLARLTMIFRSRMIWSLSSEEQIDMYNVLAGILSNMYKGDRFCHNGHNILWSATQQRKMRARFRKSKNNIPLDLITQLDGRLWLYSEMIFSRWHNLAHEFHGPYNYNQESLLVKEWHDLGGLLEEVFKNFPYKKITCYEFYKDNTITLDIHNRLVAKKSLARTMTRAFIEINGKFIDARKTKKIIKTLDKYLIKGANYLAKKNKADLKISNALMEFYSIKPLADALGQDWRPPKEVYNSIKRKTLTQKTLIMLKRLQFFYFHVSKKNVQNQYDPSKKFK